MQRGFSEKIYLNRQQIAIAKRIGKFSRLYLEFGGKLAADFHAARVLPGYKIETKLRLLKKLPETEILYCVNAKDIQSKRIIDDYNLKYDKHALFDLEQLRKKGIKIKKVIITRYSGEKAANSFAVHLRKIGFEVYFHHEIKGYPENTKEVLKKFEEQSYIPVTKKIIAITAPASGSGKMAVALSQIYHERKQGIKTGFAKNETFPIWNLPLNHPINIAYESATADLQDKNMLDPYYLKAYRKEAVNYNRDIENFAILKKIACSITHEKYAFGYKSPTDMGINQAKEGIINESMCKKAAQAEILHRYRIYKKEKASKKTMQRMEDIMRKAGLKNVITQKQGR